MPSRTQGLTDARLRNLKPAAKPYKVFDAGGLYLQITPVGGRHWRLKFRVFGKEQLLSFGSYPEVSLAEARAKRDDARIMLREGVDPAAARRDAKRAATLRAANTFEAVAREWVEKRRDTWTPDHA